MGVTIALVMATLAVVGFLVGFREGRAAVLVGQEEAVRRARIRARELASWIQEGRLPAGHAPGEWDPGATARELERELRDVAPPAR